MDKMPTIIMTAIITTMIPVTISPSSFSLHHLLANLNAIRRPKGVNTIIPEKSSCSENLAVYRMIGMKLLIDRMQDLLQSRG
jgi:hypothetical protein